MSKALSKPKDLEGSLNTGKSAAGQNDALSGYEGEATVAGQHLQDLHRLPLKADANAILPLNLTRNSHLSCSYHRVGTGPIQPLRRSDAVLEQRIEAAAHLVCFQVGPPCRARGPPAEAGRQSDAIHFHQKMEEPAPGRNAMCISCHAAAADKDYLAGTEMR